MGVDIVVLDPPAVQYARPNAGSVKALGRAVLARSTGAYVFGAQRTGVRLRAENADLGPSPVRGASTAGGGRRSSGGRGRLPGRGARGSADAAVGAAERTGARPDRALR